ncbi:TOX high mobility group box family member 3-like isoform X3 [Hyposmocoma kahamanoa]|uniref:TOX high mobility group box family member 3-like isoform X3 n=1 Tax=Hyposmocoma kahamanoa TaxID=1477025 RepID=UPI000E6D6EC4|nr:TOX high mobility group box family member 3-like isoform X3 [Hyposmocoma kahamanoa]
MEATACPEDHHRAYKLYNMYKRPENIELSASRDTKLSVYAMNDQTFHTPSFGDEEFDIPMIHGQHVPSSGVQNSHIQYTQLHPAPQVVGMMNPAQDGLAPPGGAPSYQQPLYLQEPHTPVTSHGGAGAPAGNYMIQQQPGGQQRLLMMQPAQQVMSGPPTPNTPTQPSGPVYGSPQRASPPGTTSDDSDDSVPSHQSQLPGDAESLLPIHYCSASRQQQTTLHQIGVANMGVKRSSPEPIDNGINRGQMQKKPKVQKKKKKRDPNEPQKPVSAYALFFRDTQAAIKGQNPNASFGEVSKIVASMWDGLDSEHKSVYKQKTEVAKKEYLKALAAYRASLVSKGGEQESPTMYNHTNNTNPAYGNYYQGQTYGNGHSPQGYGPNTAPQGYTPQNYPGGQPQGTYPRQAPHGYPPNPQQSPQGYQGTMPHNPQQYQGQHIPSQSPQGYQVNPTTSPQNCQPNLAHSPIGYEPEQSPTSYPPNSGLSPPGYRQVQSQSPPMGAVHAMQYHQQQMQQTHQQMQQAHQVQQYQQQQQMQQSQHTQQQMPQQHAQQHAQQNHAQQPHPQQQMQQHPQPQQHQQNQQQQHQNQQQPPPQQPPPQQTQPQQNQLIKAESHSPNSNGNAGMPQKSPDQNENRSTPSCIRQGCTNPAIANSEWEDEYCSNECVVSHCRDVFSSWVASNNSNQIQSFSAVK